MVDVVSALCYVLIATPQAVVALREQYRMSADIMLLANTIVYDGQLRCGAQAVADASLDLQLAPSQMPQPSWLQQVCLQLMSYL